MELIEVISMNERVIIAGSRSIDTRETVWRVIDSYLAGDYHTDGWDEGADIEIVHGGANGVDTTASEFAELCGYEERVFNPAWDEHGEAAGPIRNAEMAEYGDRLLAIWDGESRGTRNMIENALDYGIDVHVKVIDDG